MESEEESNAKSKTLWSDIRHLCAHILKMAYELLSQDVCEKLSMLEDGIMIVLELKSLLPSITDELKQTFFSGFTDEIKLPKGLIESLDPPEMFENDSLIDCNVSNESPEEDLVINKRKSEDENRTQDTGTRGTQKVGENEEIDNTTGRSRQLPKFGSGKNLILKANNAYNVLQTIMNELEKQHAVKVQARYSKDASWDLDLIKELVFTGKVLVFTGKVWEKKVEKIEENSDEDQPYSEEKKQATHTWCKHIRSKKMPSLLFYKPGFQASLDLKAMKSVNELLVFKQLLHVVMRLKLIIEGKAVEEVEKEVENERNFIFEIEENFEEEKKAIQKGRCKD